MRRLHRVPPERRIGSRLLGHGSAGGRGCNIWVPARESIIAVLQDGGGVSDRGSSHSITMKLGVELVVY